MTTAVGRTGSAGRASSPRLLMRISSIGRVIQLSVRGEAGVRVSEQRPKGQTEDDAGGITVASAPDEISIILMVVVGRPVAVSPRQRRAAVMATSRRSRGRWTGNRDNNARRS